MRFKIRTQNPTTKEEIEREDREYRASQHPDTGTETRVQQHYTDETNLNVMMKRFGVDPSNLPPQALDPRYYGDFTDGADYREAVERTTDALRKFDSLPAEIRKEHDHNPAKFFEWVSDPKNQEEAVRKGILSQEKPPKAPEPMPVKIIADTPSPATGAGASNAGATTAGGKPTTT